jgi:hypothetical protein
MKKVRKKVDKSKKVWYYSEALLREGAAEKNREGKGRDRNLKIEQR